MISQLFILAPRGDTVVKKEFRFDVPKNTPEVFFRAARFWRDGEKAPAVFHERGVNYLHVKVRVVESSLSSSLSESRLPSPGVSPFREGNDPRKRSPETIPGKDHDVDRLLERPTIRVTPHDTINTHARVFFVVSRVIM